MGDRQRCAPRSHVARDRVIGFPEFPSNSKLLNQSWENSSALQQNQLVLRVALLSGIPLKTRDRVGH